MLQEPHSIGWGSFDFFELVYQYLFNTLEYLHVMKLYRFEGVNDAIDFWTSLGVDGVWWRECH